MHRGTVEGGGVTRVGDRNLLMIGSHLGHDCQVGNGCVLVNGALAAGHVRLEDGCILSGHSAVQQRVRIGRLAMLGGLASTTKDVPPFVLQQGYNCVTGLNLVGLRRAGMSNATISALRETFRASSTRGAATSRPRWSESRSTSATSLRSANSWPSSATPHRDQPRPRLDPAAPGPTSTPAGARAIRISGHPAGFSSAGDSSGGCGSCPGDRGTLASPSFFAAWPRRGFPPSTGRRRWSARHVVVDVEGRGRGHPQARAGGPKAAARRSRPASGSTTRIP